MTLVMKPFGWIVVAIDGVLGGINLGWYVAQHYAHLASLIGCLVVLCLGTFQIYALNTEEINDTRIK